MGVTYSNPQIPNSAELFANILDPLQIYLCKFSCTLSSPLCGAGKPACMQWLSDATTEQMQRLLLVLPPDKED